MLAHDVVVIGAGPGGSAAAHALSRSGLDVLLLDRADFPRDKTCGDGLTPRALRALDRMGVLHEVAAKGCRVDSYQVVAPSGRSTAAPQAGLVVPRVQLDEILLRHAVQSGAQFRPRVVVVHVERTTKGVRVHADGGQILEARLAIIATGAATSVLRRSDILARQPRMMLAARAYFDDLQQEVPRSFQLRFDNAPSPGYGWVFPVGPHKANVGVAYLPGKQRGTANQAFHGYIRGRAMATLLNGARMVGPEKGYPIRVDCFRAPTSAANTLLVGEAAGLVHPLTGEGIDFALDSGLLAAEHVIRGLESRVHATWLADYDRLLRDRFEQTFRFGEWIRDWVCKPPLLNALVPLANRRPELRHLLAGVVTGEREAPQNGPATAARLVMYLARHHRVTAHD